MSIYVSTPINIQPTFASHSHSRVVTQTCAHTFHIVKHTGLCPKHIQISTQYTQANIGAHARSHRCENVHKHTHTCTRMQIHTHRQAGTHTGVCPPGLACRGAVGEGPCVSSCQLTWGECVSRPSWGCIRAHLPWVGLGVVPALLHQWQEVVGEIHGLQPMEG